ncbi:hypothetical protein [Corynebacterium vitaeruminis]|uniref:hypothetical protein n=1 Tax=Corynebacterium vitaeruminis TaxID=38305 RepID=UPI0023F0829C|nr:hypothetical protein [Corynebacterium vitaeruminis]
MTTIDQLTETALAMTSTLMAIEDEIEWRELAADFNTTPELRKLRSERRDLIEQIKAVKAEIKQAEEAAATPLPEIDGAEESRTDTAVMAEGIIVRAPRFEEVSHGLDIIATIDGIAAEVTTQPYLYRIHTEDDGRKVYYVREELTLMRVDGMSGRLMVEYALRERSGEPDSGDPTHPEDASARISCLWFRGDDGAKSKSELGEPVVELIAMQEWAKTGRGLALDPALSRVARHAGRLARLERMVEVQERMLRGAMVHATDVGLTPHRVSVVAGFTAPKATRWIERGVVEREGRGKVFRTPRKRDTEHTV